MFGSPRPQEMIGPYLISVLMRIVSPALSSPVLTMGVMIEENSALVRVNAGSAYSTDLIMVLCIAVHAASLFV